MSLQETIKKDLTSAMKAKDVPKKDTIRIILGEFSRFNTKQVSDDDVVKVLRKLIKSEKEVLARTGGDAESQYIQIVSSYLPRTADEEEITAWIRDNVDFAKFKNKMQSMGQIMKHFGSRAEGNVVKRILQNLT